MNMVIVFLVAVLLYLAFLVGTVAEGIYGMSTTTCACNDGMSYTVKQVAGEYTYKDFQGGWFEDWPDILTRGEVID